MGSEVLEECRPIMPLPTITIHRISNLNEGRPLTDELAHNSKEEILCSHGGEEECRTPRSADEHTLSSAPLVCPPPPRKPRPARRKLRRPSQPYFKVPDDLASVFILLISPSKKVRTS